MGRAPPSCKKENDGAAGIQKKIMSDHAILLWTFIITTIGVVAGVAVLVATWLTIRDARRTAKAQFWTMLRGVFAWYDDIHCNFRPKGDWHGSSDLPKTAQDMGRTELYLGLFEYCDKLLEEQLLDSRDFKRWYWYRLTNVVANRWVIEQKLVAHRKDWRAFINLCYRLGVEMPSDVPRLTADERSELYPKGKGNT